MFHASCCIFSVSPHYQENLTMLSAVCHVSISDFNYCIVTDD